MTNFVETIQTQGLCEEVFNILEFLLLLDFTYLQGSLIQNYFTVNATCINDGECVDKSIYINNWNGLPTGRCIQSKLNSTVNVCELASWCPIIHDENFDLYLFILL